MGPLPSKGGRYRHQAQVFHTTGVAPGPPIRGSGGRKPSVTQTRTRPLTVALQPSSVTPHAPSANRHPQSRSRRDAGGSRALWTAPGLRGGPAPNPAT